MSKPRSRGPNKPPRSRYQDLTDADRQTIADLTRQKYGTRVIARKMGTSRKIVRRVLDELGIASVDPPPPQERKIDAYLEQIEDKAKQELTVKRIFREIADLGYTGGQTMLGEQVRKVRAQLPQQARRTATKRRFETPAGLEMQVDWSPGTVEIAGRPTRIHVLGVVLSSSRRLFIGIYRDERESTLLEGLATAFTYFDGCAMRSVFDNMSTVVLGRVGSERKPLWHPRFLEFARYYGFEPYLCAVADPDRKGKIEKSFRYFFEDFLKGSVFESWDDLTRRIRIWLDETPGAGNLRKHGTTGLVPNEAFLTERDLLIRLPEHRFPVYEEVIRAVDQDSTLSVQGIRYSVPAHLAQRQAVVRLFAEHFEVYDSRGAMAASCRYVDRSTFKGSLVIDPTHYAGLPRRPGKGRGVKRADLAFVERFPDLAPLADGLKCTMKGLAAVHIHILLRLAETYGLEAFMAAALQAQTNHRFNAYAVRRILERDAPLQPESHHTTIGGLGPALLGEVEETSLDEFAHLDQQPVTTSEDDNGDQ